MNMVNLNTITGNALYINSYSNKTTHYQPNFGQICLKPSEKVAQNRVKNTGGLMNSVVKFLKRLCEPTKSGINAIRRNITYFEYIDNGGLGEDYITSILKTLKIHSKNPELTKFVEEGVKFFQDNKNNSDLYYCEKFATPCLDKGGCDLRFTIGSAYEKAIKPKSKNINETRLNENITHAREYMTAFAERGEHLYPDGFIYPSKK